MPLNKHPWLEIPRNTDCSGKSYKTSSKALIKNIKKCSIGKQLVLNI